MNYDYNVVVIGAGSAGLVVASGSATLGAKVALVEKDRMGGDCLNTGCVPSKTFLKSAHLAEHIRNSKNFGLSSSLEKIDLSEVMNRVKSVIKSIEPNDSKEKFEKMGVNVFIEEANLLDNHTVKIGDKTISCKYIVIATGSKPLVPPILGLKDVPYLTNKNIFDLNILPKHLIVLGGGPIGLELGQGFRHLGSEVSIIDMLPHLFPNDDPEVAPIMERKLESDGVELYLSAKIVEVKCSPQIHSDITVIIEKDGLAGKRSRKELKGDHLLVSLGRVPSSKGMGLEEAGVKTDKRGYIITNEKLQTSIKNIYACGDVVGPYLFTHIAGYQAGIVVRNMIFPFSAKVDYSAVPWTTYTKPEIAHVGYTEPLAKSLGLYKSSVVVNLKEIDRAKTEGEEIGFLKLILGKRNRIIGATFVSDMAGEIIPLASLAIKQKLKATKFAKLIFSYPTKAEIFKFASYKLIKGSFKDWMKKVIKFLLR